MLRGLAAICVFLAVAAAGYGPGPTDDPSAAAPLPFFYDLYTFRGEGGETDVVAAIAVQAGRLRRERSDEGGRYRFDVRFVLADTAQRSVFRSIDSVYVSLPYALPRLHLLHTFVEVQAPPSASMIQRVVVTDATRPGVGQLYDSPFPIPDYSGTGLLLSDVAFGVPDAVEGWTRRGYTLALLPTSQFPSSAFDVYYEIYNLPAGAPYETEIAVAPIDSEGDVVRARFAGESAAGPDGSVTELRRVESALPSGRYRLTVTVSERLTGRTAQRSRLIEVRGRGEGMTLVQALPRAGS